MGEEAVPGVPGGPGSNMPKWQRAPEDMVRIFGDLVRPMPGVELRKMFGYPCAFVGGQMFTGLHQDKMILRLAEEDRARFLALDGASQFEPMAGRPMREYVVVPPAMIGRPADLTAWLDKALAYTASLPPKAPRKANKGRKQP